MDCPKCFMEKTRVLETRAVTHNGEKKIRRKRKCCACDEHFYTYESYSPADEELIFRVKEVRALLGNLQGLLDNVE